MLDISLMVAIYYKGLHFKMEFVESEVVIFDVLMQQAWWHVMIQIYCFPFLYITMT